MRYSSFLLTVAFILSITAAPINNDSVKLETKSNDDINQKRYVYCPPNKGGAKRSAEESVDDQKRAVFDCAGPQSKNGKGRE